MTQHLFIYKDNAVVKTTKTAQKYFDGTTYYAPSKTTDTLYALDEDGFVIDEYAAYESEEAIHAIIDDTKKPYFEFDLKLRVNRDLVPGFGYDPSSWYDVLEHYVKNTFMHYGPKLTLNNVKYVIPYNGTTLSAATCTALEEQLQERIERVVNEMHSALFTKKD